MPKALPAAIAEATAQRDMQTAIIATLIVADDLNARRELERAMRSYAHALLSVLHEVTHDERVYVREMSKLAENQPELDQNYAPFSHVVDHFEKPLRAQRETVLHALAAAVDEDGDIFTAKLPKLMEGRSSVEVRQAAQDYLSARDELMKRTHDHNLGLVAATHGMPVSYDEFLNLRGRPDFRQEATRRLLEATTQQAVM